MNLLKDLQRWREFLGEMLSLARTGADLLERGDLEAFDDLWEKRRRLFGRLEETRQRLAPALDDWEATQASLGAERAAQARATMDAIVDLGDRLAEVDEALKARLQGQRDHVAADLGRVAQGKRLREAYSPLPRTKGPAGTFSKLG